MNTDKISKFITKKRKEKKLTQQELADLTFLSEKTISKWECGRGIPDIGNLQVLSKALDVSVTEILNGEEEQKEEPVIEYIEYKEKTNKKRNILLSTMFLLILAIVVLLFIIFNNFNTVNLYELYGESEHFNFGPTLVMDSNMKDMMVEGKLEIKDNYIKEEQIKYVAYYFEDNLIIGGSYHLSDRDYYIQDDGYEDIFSKEKLNNVDKWYVVVQYDRNNESKEEVIELKVRKVMKNNKLFYKKAKSIGNSKKTMITEDEIKDKNEKELTDIRNYLEKHGFRRENDEYYTKKVNEGEFKIALILNRHASDFHFEDDEYLIIIEPYNQTYIFIDKNNLKLGLHYTRSINKYTCSLTGENNEPSIIECPKDTDKKIKYYLTIIDKEFEEMYPPKESWAM